VTTRRVLEAMVALTLTGFAAVALAQSAANDPGLAGGVQQQGNALAAALLREDFAGVAATACSPVLARVGGARALARQIEVSFKVMQQQGRRLVAMDFRPPSAVFEAAETRFALVPYRSVVQVNVDRVALDSYYLGVQNKGADNWCFIDTAALTAASLREFFPGVPPGLKLPPLSDAVVERGGTP
jgi:hypothetical protein